MPADLRPAVALTIGEPAGIGPELCVRIAGDDLPARIVLVGDRDLLAIRAAALGIAWAPAECPPDGPLPGAPVSVLHVPLSTPAKAGTVDPTNSRAVLRTLELAADGCLAGRFAAMVTAPVHKGVINDAGIPFTGHTEFLAERAGVARVVMMLVGGGMRVALATTHLALRDVASAIDRATLTETLRILDADLRRKFAIARPRILVAGLNPHAGESGHLGREELDVIGPALDELRRDGLNLVGPLSADTLFNAERLAGADCVLAMYHDQGLPVLKYASFGHGVNVTLGLPFVRTSVDHGTALELAGQGTADPGSLRAALALAVELARHAR
jgi:4-hydroxythreonine-4-phosphate dehydrogenase